MDSPGRAGYPGLWNRECVLRLAHACHVGFACDSMSRKTSRRTTRAKHLILQSKDLEVGSKLGGAWGPAQPKRIVYTLAPPPPCMYQKFKFFKKMYLYTSVGEII